MSMCVRFVLPFCYFLLNVIVITNHLLRVLKRGKVGSHFVHKMGLAAVRSHRLLLLSSFLSSSFYYFFCITCLTPFCFSSSCKSLPAHHAKSQNTPSQIHIHTYLNMLTSFAYAAIRKERRLCAKGVNRRRWRLQTMPQRKSTAQMRSLSRGGIL